VIVFSLIGPSGSGKSTIWEKIGQKGYVHFKEGYMDSNRGPSNNLPEIDNRLFVSKLNYLANWLNQVREYENSGVALVVSDRSPWDVPAYVNPEGKLYNYVAAFMKELSTLGIEHKTCYVFCPEKILTARVAERLKRDAFRKAYNEGNPSLLSKTCRYYERHRTEWDYIVDNSGPLQSSVSEVEKILTSLKRAPAP